MGAFFIGWIYAYDISVVEAGTYSTTLIEKAKRTDLFGGKHTYARDADGLYTPPAYHHDELSRKYDQELAKGPSAPTEDSQKGMDGTVKHFIDGGTNSDGSTNHNERNRDTITDPHGNQTVLTYGGTATMADGSTQKLLTKVTEPVGRSIHFTWTNIGTTGAPAYRITEVEGPFDATDSPVSGGTYKVDYAYYTNASHPESFQNLHTVTLDSEGLARTTTYTYTSVSGTYTDPVTSATSTVEEDGLLASISDALSHTVTYNYSLNSASSAYPDRDGGSNYSELFPTKTVWVNGTSEPASDNGSAVGVNSQLWTFSVYLDDPITGCIAY